VAHWVHADDGTRLRVGLWKSGSREKGTILLFPGRTEYIEKYGRTVTDLVKLGYSVLIVDWRGQGLSDRITEDPMTGHVLRFIDYQKDVAAMVKTAEELDLPKPWYMLGHSLGACIGLRALKEGLSVSACAFTSPMWSIKLPAVKRAAAWPLSWAAQSLGKGHVYAPGTNGSSYVLSTPYEDNRLTNDPEMYQYFIRQATTLTDHQIGGPSMGWLFQTLKETNALSQKPSPEVPCMTLCGTNDALIEVSTVQKRMAHWSDGKFEQIQDAKHDLLSEVSAIRQSAVEKITQHFEEASDLRANLENCA
jgi:lysophospholipase